MPRLRAAVAAHEDVVAAVDGDGTKVFALRLGAFAGAA